MSRFPNAALGDVCTIQQGKTLLKKDMADEGFPVFGANGHIGWADEYHYDKPVVVIGCRGSCGATHTTLPKSFVTNNAMALLPKNTDDLHMDFLRVVISSADLSKVITGGVQPQITRANLKQHEIPLPPIEEQRRIVDILNRAASIERLKASASAHLRDFIPALFLKMFGDPIDNPMGWPVEKLASLVVDGARNGLSPSRKGLVRGEVLTLSAITRGAFDPTAHKEGTFSHPIPAEQTVTKDRFLLCRGNGNLDLVGRGHFPSIDMPGIAFPDTIIAVEPRKDRLEPAFLEALWESRYIREQVERAAKTTNGTYKINQGSLLDFRIPVPPIADQRKFAALVAAARSKIALATSSAELASDLSQSLLDKLLRVHGSQPTYHGEPMADAIPG